MSNKIVKFDHEVRENIRLGIEILSKAVKTTMGPRGKTVLIERPGLHPIVTKDGVTVAKSINLANPFQNLGLQIVKEAASRSAEEAGDGTTTATVLTQALYESGLRYISAGIDSVILRNGLEKASEDLLAELSKLSRKIDNDEDLLNIALVSCNNEKETAKLIFRAIKSVGSEGSIIVEEAKGYRSDLKIVEGFQVDRGYMSPYFVTDEDKNQAILEKCHVLILNKKIENIKEVVKPLEASLESGKPILLIANEIDNEALQGLVLNKLKGNLKVCAIKSPGFGDARHDLLGDIATITGAEVIDHSHDIDNFDSEWLGECKKIIVDRTGSLFIADNENIKEKIDNRIQVIKDTLDDPGLETKQREYLNYRLQRLKGGVAILRVGAATEAEMIERRDRVDDALHATRAALEEGIIPGGGVSLIIASENLSNSSDNPAYAIIKNACQSPLKQIVRNTGKSPELVVEKIKENTDADFGYDARKGIYGNMYELGVIDPHKVVRCAIQNACSAASLLLTSDCAIVEEK
jgi:chaperonin GroEL